jgi:hypothetical protein
VLQCSEQASGDPFRTFLLLSTLVGILISGRGEKERLTYRLRRQAPCVYVCLQAKPEVPLVPGQ